MDDAVSRSGPGRALKALSARLCAVQAVYQHRVNPGPQAALLEEYPHRRKSEDAQGETLPDPDGALLKNILHGVRARRAEIDGLVRAHLNPVRRRDLEPLLEAVLLCGAEEILRGEADAPLIINDYLEIAHGFYSQGEVALVNAVLDAVAAALKD